MSSSDRRTLIAGLSALVALPLAGCNFRPVHGPGGAGPAIRDRIRASDPATRIEFEMVARLETRIGSGGEYDLLYTLAIDQRDLAIDGAQNIDRVNVIGTLDYSLRDRASGRVLDQGALSSFTGYATTASPVATTAARRDAEDRLAVILADQLVARLIASAPGWS